jgi:hypothetical protein
MWGISRGGPSAAAPQVNRGFMIDEWIVALFALLASLCILCARRRVDRLFAFPFMMQFVLYSIFEIFPLSLNTMQFSARLNNILMDVAVIVLIIVMRVRYGK